MSRPWFPSLVEPTATAVRRGIASRLDSFTPEWTGRRVEDPGVAMVKVFAEQAVILRRQANRLTGQVVRAHLQLAAVSRVPVVPARVRLEVTLAPEADRAVTLPEGVQLVAPAPPGASDPVTFETVRPLSATPAALGMVVVTAGRSRERLAAAELKAGAPVEPFGRRPGPGNSAWFGFSRGAAPDELSLGFELRRSGLVAVEAGTGNRAPDAPVVTWDATTATGMASADVAEDSTDGFRQSGLVALRLPPGWTAVDLPDLGQTGGAVRWLRARLCYGTYTRPPTITRILVNAVDAVAVRTRREEVLEPTVDPLRPGRPRFRLAAAPVVRGSVELAIEGPDTTDVFELGEGGPPRRWEERESLAASGPDDRHFVVDVDTGEILFGDGVHGAAPPTGFRNIQAVRYQVPAGASSRIAANASFSAVENIAFLREVTNPMPATGGYDPVPVDALDESSDRELAAYGAATHRARGRAVVGPDYEVLARAVAGGGVSRAIAWPGRALDGSRRAGVVSIFVVGRPGAPGDQPVPEEATLEAVVRGLLPHAPPGVRLAAAAPEFVPVSVRAVVAGSPDLAVGTVVTSVAEKLDAYLDPVTGGDDGWGWPLGGPLLHRRLAAVVASAKGVERVDSLSMTVRGRERGNCDDGALPWNGLPWPSGHDVVPITPGRLT